MKYKKSLKPIEKVVYWVTKKNFHSQFAKDQAFPAIKVRFSVKSRIKTNLSIKNKIFGEKSLVIVESINFLNNTSINII